MRYLLVNAIFLLLSGCVSSPLTQIEPPSIQAQPIKLREPVLHVVEATIIEPILDKYKYELKEAPFTSSHFGCGWTTLTDQEQIRLMLEKADIVIKLTDVYEKWIPINGKPKRYYVLKVE